MDINKLKTMTATYIVWELISPYDGYSTTECATWEEACACIKAVMEAPGVRRSAEAKRQYNDWKSGKIDKIYVITGKGMSKTVDLEIFITSTPLTGPL